MGVTMVRARPTSVLLLAVAVIGTAALRSVEGTAAAPRTLYLKSSTSPSTGKEAVSAMSVQRESVLEWLQQLSVDDTEGGMTPEEQMLAFNEFGPYLSSYISSPFPGLPGQNYIHYPADRTSDEDPQQNTGLPLASEGSFPLAVYSYGYGATCTLKPARGGSLHMEFMAYLASWGIVVGCPTDRVSDNWDGAVLTRLMDAMEGLNNDSESMFYGRLKTERFATIGRSYGGNRAINAGAKNSDRVAAIISDAQCTASWCTPLREADVAAPTLYLIGDRDEYLGGVQYGYNRLNVPKQLLIARYRTHDSAPMQVWRAWVVAFILLHVNGDGRLASTVWGPAFYSTPVTDAEWGRISIGSYRTSKYLNYWPNCANTLEDNGGLGARYEACPPMACPETQVATVSAASGPSSSSSPFDTPEAFQQAKAIARQESFNPEIMAMPSRIDIDEASTASDLERESMRHGLVSFFSNEDTMKAVIAEIGQNLDLSDEDSFEVAAVRLSAADMLPRPLPAYSFQIHPVDRFHFD